MPKSVFKSERLTEAVTWALSLDPRSNGESVEAVMRQAGGPRALSLAAETIFLYGQASNMAGAYANTIRNALLELNHTGVIPDGSK